MYRDFNDPANNHSVLIDVRSKEISAESLILLEKLLEENQELKKIFLYSSNFEIAKKSIRKWVMEYLNTQAVALDYFYQDIAGRENYDKLSWKDIAAIRILDYLNHEGVEFKDLNLRGKHIISSPFKTLWYAIKEGKGGGEPDFFRDILHLFRQYSGKSERNMPSRSEIESWMNNHPSGLDADIIEQRKKNKDRIIRLFIKKIDAGDIHRSKFSFAPGLTFWKKYKILLEWWDDRIFHLQFAARSPERLNRMLGRSLDETTMENMMKAHDSGIPFFVNPYYLSLLNVDIDEKYKDSDRSVRDYVMVSEQLVNEFGYIVAWEKEDVVEPGKPNAAGWLLPNQRNIHRRYPEVAILIPDTTGRACGGLCVSCQRMYDFQDGHLNFDLEELKPVDSWWERLPKLMKYFEKDSKLRDILITGGDALMSSDNALKRILDEVYIMAKNKRENNEHKKEGDKFAEILRIRLGTRLPVYLPQRITPGLIKILREFKERASQIGIEQFIIQTHFESAMEVTPESALGIKRLISAGWTVTNQLVFTAAASRRGHTAKLRKVLNDIGILSYYTFSVKGYQENAYNFATNARAVQEQIEEKHIGEVPKEFDALVKSFPTCAEDNVANIESLRQACKVPFLATDRNVINLPGVGKSLTFRTIGITFDGRRILEFDHDHTRTHSPIINDMGKVVIIESKSIASYLRRLSEMGENVKDYTNVWGYSIGETEPRMPVFEYPEYDFEITDEFTNLEL